MPAMIDASWTRTASSATSEEVVQDGGDGISTGDAVGDGVGRVGGDDPARRHEQRHRRCARAAARRSPRLPGAQGLQHVAHAGGHRAAAERDQDGVERRLRRPPAPGRWSPRPRRSRCPGCPRPAGCRRCRAMAAARSRAVSKSPSTSSSFAPSARMRSSLAAGAKREATTVTSSPRRRPDQARAWPRLPALAHTTARRPCSASRLATSSVPRPLKLRTGFAVSSLMLTVHPRAGSSASHRYSGVSRNTGSITPRAASTRPPSSRVRTTTPRRYPRPGPAPRPSDSAAPRPAWARSGHHATGGAAPRRRGGPWATRGRDHKTAAERTHVRGARLPRAVGVVRRRPVIPDHHPNRRRAERGPAGLGPAADIRVTPGPRSPWAGVAGHSGGRYWDRTSDLLGVNEALSR